MFGRQSRERSLPTTDPIELDRSNEALIIFPSGFLSNELTTPHSNNLIVTISLHKLTYMVTLHMTTAKEPPKRPEPASFVKSTISQLKPQRHSEAPANKPSDKLNSNGCQFTFADGRHCKMPPAHLCAHHARKRRRTGAEGAPDAALEGLCRDLTTATNINRALAQVFLLTAQGRISQKQAVAFGYLSQLLLQTVPGIRSEFVSAFGYYPWEQRLKTSLESNLTMRSASSSRATNRSEGSLSDSPSTPDENPGLTGQNDESEPGAPVSTPLDKPIVDPRPFEERVMEPDYDSIVSRGRDLLAGKYSVTPEGRREAETLNTELELMKPPAAKMPKGARASVIEHMKRWIAQKKVAMRPASPSRANNVSEGPLRSPAFPALNYYGHPIPMAVPYDEIERDARSASSTPSPRISPPTDELSPPPSSEILNIKSPVVPVSPPSSRTSTVSPDPPPTRRPRKPRRSTQTPASEPSPRLSPPAFAPELALASNPPNSTAHATDWYTPPAWTRNRASDPFPSRKEKRKRELRGMSNSKLRHLQHLNSRAF